jgi:hypothetical protein
MYRLLRGVVSRADAQVGSLTGIDLEVLVHAASVIYFYLLIAAFAVTACKRYVKDGSGAISMVHVLCVYGKLE